jgi:hypothetical protein
MKKAILDKRMLTDEHMNLAQHILCEQFPVIGGFQNTLLCQNDGMIPVQNEAIQIHYVGNHWVTSSSIGGTVDLFDSKFHGKLCSTLTHQLALVYRTLAESFDDDTSEIPINIPRVQQQEGCIDCGLFALAFAVHTALGDDLTMMMFNQSLMRPHLVNCLRDGVFKPFPHKKVQTIPIDFTAMGTHGPYLSFFQLELFCECLMPETYDNMVACDECELWYHLRCVNLPELPAEDQHWICAKCK